MAPPLTAAGLSSLCDVLTLHRIKPVIFSRLVYRVQISYAYNESPKVFDIIKPGRKIKGYEE